jgi:hypothetical protein
MHRPVTKARIEQYPGLLGRHARRRQDRFDRVSFTNWRPRIDRGMATE